MYPFFYRGRAARESEPALTQVAHSVTSAGDGHISGSLQVDASRRSIEGARGIALSLQKLNLAFTFGRAARHSLSTTPRFGGHSSD